MNLFVASFSTYLVLGVACTQASAQGTPVDGKPAAQPVQLDMQTGFAGSGVAVESGSDSSSIQLALSRNWDDVGDEWFKNHVIGIKLQAPLNKATNSGSFITSSGLTASSSLEVGYSRSFVRNADLPGYRARRAELLTLARQRCADAAENQQSRTDCGKGTWAQLSTDYATAAEMRELRDEGFLDTNVWMVGGTLGVGYADFKFRDQQSFAELSSTETPYNISAFAGVSPSSSPSYFGVGYEYKIQYKDADEQTFCPAGSAVTPVECFTSPFLSPVMDVDSTVFLVARRQHEFRLGGAKSLPVGVELKLAYDLKDDVIGASLPIYFLADKEAGLRGGIRLDWQDDGDRDVVFGVFVATAFDLFSSR